MTGQKKLVFTNGCFDLLHVGHVRLLKAARELGDELVVGLNSDASVGRLKGPSRPVLPAEQRAEVLAALSCVDRVIEFDEDTPEALVRELRPDVLVKGADWTGKDIAGAEFVRARGGEVVFVPLVEGVSTTGILFDWFKRWCHLEHVLEV